MVCGKGDHLIIVQFQRLRLLFIDPCGSGGHIKQLDDGRTLCALIDAAQSADVVRRNAPLPVGRSRQRHKRLLAGDEMPDLHRVSHRIDVRIRGLHVFVDDNGAFLPQCKTGFPGKPRFRKDARCHQNEIGPDAFLLPGCLRRPCRPLHLNPKAALIRNKARHGPVQPQIQALPPQVCVYLAGHIIIQRRQHLILHLNQGDLQPFFHQILCGFQPDEAAAHNDRTLRLLFFQILPDRERILHRPQGHDARIFHTGQCRTDRFCAGGKKQLIIGFRIFFACFQIPDPHCLLLRIDGNRFISHPHIDAETAAEAFRRLHRKRALFPDHAANIVGQAAVGIGNIAAPFQHDDFRFFVQTAQPGRRGGASRHSADDDNFHTPHPIIPSSAFWGFTPTEVAVTFPSRKTSSVGIPITRYFSASCGFSSTLIFPTVTSGCFAANCSMMGENILQGPHQSAQKSTTAVPCAFKIFSSKLFPSIFKTAIFTPFPAAPWPHFSSTGKRTTVFRASMLRSVFG